MKNGFPRRFKVFLNIEDLRKVVFLNAVLFRGKMAITIVKFIDQVFIYLKISTVSSSYRNSRERRYNASIDI